MSSRTNEPGNLSKGMGYTVPVLSERIREFCASWNVRASGVADDAIFAQGGHSRSSIADEFASRGNDALTWRSMRDWKAI